MTDKKFALFGSVCFVVAASCASRANSTFEAHARQIGVPPPPLGWSSWNPLGNGISQRIIEQQADALVELNKAIPNPRYRYQYVNIDSGWWLPVNGGRNSSGGFAVNPSAWDNGSLADTIRHIHQDGLLAGAYTDAGKTGCGQQNGSEGHYGPDLTRFAALGLDYVKVDFCGGKAEDLDPRKQYTEVARAIRHAEFETGWKMVFSVCDWGYVDGPAGFPDTGEGPWAWAPGVGGLKRVIWRTSGDITYQVGASAHATFQDVLDNFHSGIHPTAQHTGFYNDPDMMVVGVRGVDVDPADPVQSRAHMSLWAISGAPMILGSNLVTLQAERSPMVGVLTNEEVIKVDQDTRGLQGIEIATPAPGVEVWAKLLAGSGQRAVVMLNTTRSTLPVTISWSELGLDPNEAVSVEDLWSHSGVTPSGSSSITLTVPAEGARMLGVHGTDLAPTKFERISDKGSGRRGFDLAATGVAGGAKIFPFQNGIDFLDIAYRNVGRSTRLASMTVGGQPAATVAFPPTRGDVGTVTVAARLTRQGDNDLTFSTLTAPATDIESVALVAGPKPVFSPLHLADATVNTLSGTAVVRSCPSCDVGKDVGFIGTNAGGSGALTFHDVEVPASGRYIVLIAYANGDNASPGTGSPRSAEVSVNEGAPTRVSFPVAGRDFDTMGVIPLAVTLRAGRNSIAFANPSGYAPDLVALDIKGD